MLVNKLKWVSSKNASEEILKELNEKMAVFYSKMAKRQAYQEMIDEAHASHGDPVNLLTNVMIENIIEKGVSNILEIGCGSGKIFKQLKQKGYKGKYTGIEMAAPVIENNKVNLPEASWHTGSVYDYCTDQKIFDCCIAFFVLEHLIYPEEALKKMLGTLIPGGRLLLVFPDFSYSGIFPSQKIGLAYGKGTKEKLMKLKLADAFISYFEARIMAYKLKRINQDFGQFVINVDPFCLSSECTALTPDVDAVYISNKREIEKWSKKLGYDVDYPGGDKQSVSHNPFMEIKKTIF